jgi:hypothetical protein
MFYNSVSIENSDSRPLTAGSRGLFMEVLDVVTGWAAFVDPDTQEWSFRGYEISKDDFDPNNAPDLS